MDATVQFKVNAADRSVTTDLRRKLLDVLREDLQLTGAKYGCGEGRCGACVVLVDGKRTFSCRVPISDVADKSITTIEGLASGDTLHPVQQAFLDESALQCGYCTAGMVLGTVALLAEKPQPSDEEINGWMNRQLCRAADILPCLRLCSAPPGGHRHEPTNAHRLRLGQPAPGI